MPYVYKVVALEVGTKKEFEIRANTIPDMLRKLRAEYGIYESEIILIERIRIGY